MDKGRNVPWPGIFIAVAVSLAMGLVGTNPWLVLGAGLLWIGSLFLVSSHPPPPNAMPPKSPFSQATITQLIEHSATPLLMTELNRVAIANEAARKVLGSHIVGQDVRVAFRHPEAIALMMQDRPGSALIQNLARRKDIWQMNRQIMDDRFAVVELLNQTSEAQVSRAHTDFVANASHELRTPLASIIGYVETLSDEEAAVPPATRKKFLTTILSEANRLQGLVSDLMSLSRVEAEKYDEPEEKIELRKLVETATRDAAGEARMGRIDAQLPNDVTVLGDARQLEQLVRNLVDNALKYGDADKNVTVSLLNDDNGDAKLTVQDRGDGIAPEHIPHLTRRFYRTDPGRSRASGGTGLGLAIVKHIVERHRGRLDISSEVGQGTLVTVRIPAFREPAEYLT
ncbi:sensor histidine kinase [Allopontixanthobacter sediminis]|uniref:histidine kinase n=1 Tax=Allopontixanthobacter sediminis TaxID=1689985 RepID=A0A845B802_9SPHN|nr:ATP-binding protein [Allopontixanthobacter sediminis]MXP43749.1 two-component sensor histidine kinase [Allopontixanthobacter sediminis]